MTPPRRPHPVFRRRLAVASVLLGASILACGPSAAPTSPAPSAAAPQPPAATAPTAASSAPAPAPAAAASPAPERTVRIGIPSKAISWFAGRVAQDKGYYQEENLDTQWIQSNSTAYVAGLLSGELHFITDTSAAARLAVLHDTPLRFVMAMSVKPQQRFMVQPHVQSFDDLNGQTVAITAPGDFIDWVARALFRRNDADASRVTWLSVTGSPERLLTVQTGQVAGAVLGIPYDLEAGRSGLVQLGDLAGQVDISFVGLNTTEEFLRQERDVVRRMVRATLRGLNYARANRDENIQSLVSDYNLSLEDATAVYEMGLRTWSEDGTATNVAWDNTLDVARLTVQLPPDASVMRFVDMSVLEEARRSLPR
jgi:ABC-type nitrate/sulfonate/bicarbonate transport system substrate-binding protein